MARVMGPEIRYLAFHPDVAVFTLYPSAHGRNQIANKPHLPRRGGESEAELVSGIHSLEFIEIQSETNRQEARGRTLKRVRSEENFKQSGLAAAEPAYQSIRRSAFVHSRNCKPSAALALLPAGAATRLLSGEALRLGSS